jgi:hypothetical protein
MSCSDSRLEFRGEKGGLVNDRASAFIELNGS